jgi:chromosome partitioning protein
MPVALESIRDIVHRSSGLQAELKRLNYSPVGTKRLEKLFNITEVAKLVGRTTTAIRDAEARGDLPSPQVDPQTRRRIGYSLTAINYMRERFATRPAHSPVEDEPCILAIQNFKGGVGKSTISVHLTQYLARAGYRVCLIDCDSQASTTRMLGYTPDHDISETDTLLPYFMGEQRGIRYAIRDTYWDQLKLIPANLSLYSAEYYLAARSRDESAHKKFYHWLRDGLNEVKGDFDVVVLDPPPALGMISLNVLYAASAVVVPLPPGMLEFHSTLQFFTMLEEVLGAINEQLEYSFVRILINRKRQRTSDASTQDDVTDLARDFYGKYLLHNVLYDSTEIESAAAVGKTVYELTGSTSSYRTYKRAIETLDSVCGEIEALIRMTWPSQRRRATVAYG